MAVDSRNELALAIRQGLVDAGTSGDPDDLDSYAEQVVDHLARPGSGWLIDNERVMKVTETDFQDSDGDGGHTWTVWTTGWLVDQEDED